MADHILTGPQVVHTPITPEQAVRARMEVEQLKVHALSELLGVLRAVHSQLVEQGNQLERILSALEAKAEPEPSADQGATRTCVKCTSLFPSFGDPLCPECRDQWNRRASDIMSRGRK